MATIQNLEDCLKEERATEEQISRETKKPARDLSGMPKEIREQAEAQTEEERAAAGNSGVFGTKRLQAMIKRTNVPSEVEVGRGVDNNAFIIIGNDRVDHPHTGYGGKGHTQCDAVDIVAGMAGPKPMEVEELKDKSGRTIEHKVYTNPNFTADAARIYISQKTNVDRNFKLCEFSDVEALVDETEEPGTAAIDAARSAIAVKADKVRLISRENIRLVTGADINNSQGGLKAESYGVELVAMNKSGRLQPLVKGDNLVLALEAIIRLIHDLATNTHGFMKYQSKFNDAVAKHTHTAPFFARPTLPSETVLASGIQTNVEVALKSEFGTMMELQNTEGVKSTYLTPGPDNDNVLYINSRLNKTN